MKADDKAELEAEVLDLEMERRGLEFEIDDLSDGLEHAQWLELTLSKRRRIKRIDARLAKLEHLLANQRE